MAKAYNHHNHRITHQTYYTNNSFLPLLCRSSIADVKLRDFRDQSTSCFSDDPSSPKVSCIGQIKRKNKIFCPFSTTPYGFPPSSTTAAQISTKTKGNQIKYTKLKKWFSSKNFVLTTTAASTVSGGGGASCRSGCREMRRRSSKIDNDNGGNHVGVNINELDPPLPVIKTPPVLPSEVSLWRRRSGGVALKTLQVQHQIHLPNNCNSTTYQPSSAQTV